MNIKRKATIIYSRNFKETNHFYAEILGFEVDMDFDSVIFYKEGIAVWTVYEEHELKKILGKNFENEAGHPFELYYEITDWEETIKRLETFEIDYLHRAIEEPWGQRTIRILDPENNIIELGEALESFMKRLFDKGMSVEEIAGINEISVKEVERILRDSEN